MENENCRPHIETEELNISSNIINPEHCSLDADIIRRAGTRTINGGLSIVRPDDYKVEAIHKQQPAPFRDAKGVSVSTLNDLVAFSKAEHLRSGINTIYFVGDGKVRAVLNYTTPDNKTCGWCDSAASFKLDYTHEWSAWKSNSGKHMSQESFCDFLDDNQGNIVQPSGAEIYDIVHDFKQQTNVSYQSCYRTSDGSTKLLYDDTNTKREMTLPETFTLRLPVIKGAEKMTTYEVKARLYTRIDRDSHKLLICYRLIRPDLPERNAEHDIAEWLRGKVQGNESTAASEVYEGYLSSSPDSII